MLLKQRDRECQRPIENDIVRNESLATCRGLGRERRIVSTASLVIGVAAAHASSGKP